MASLLDIGPLTEEVEIRGARLTVQGLTAGHIFQLFAEFPEMRVLLEMGQADPKEVMLRLAPDLLGRIIAIGTGSPNDKEVEAKAKTMGASDQLAILSAVFRLSFPQGIGPFVDSITKMVSATMTELPPDGLGDSARAAMPSPAPFSASLQTDTPGMLLGRRPRVN